MKNYPADRLPTEPGTWPRFRDAEGNEVRALRVRAAFLVTTTNDKKKQETTEYDGGYLLMDDSGLRGMSTLEFEAAYTSVPE